MLGGKPSSRSTWSHSPSRLVAARWPVLTSANRCRADLRCPANLLSSPSGHPICSRATRHSQRLLAVREVMLKGQGRGWSKGWADWGRDTPRYRAPDPGPTKPHRVAGSNARMGGVPKPQSQTKRRLYAHWSSMRVANFHNRVYNSRREVASVPIHRLFAAPGREGVRLLSV